MEITSQPVPSSVSELRRLYRFMKPRRFVASREELLDAGFSRPRIDNWIRNGRLVKVLRAVYSYGRDAETREAVCRAALLAAGTGAALTGRTACETWGIITPKPGPGKLVEVGVSSGEARTLPGLSPALRRTRVKVMSRQLEPGDVRQKDGLAVVSPALALVDLAVSASPREVRFAFLEACRLRLFDRGDVDHCYRRLAGRRGATKLRPLLALWVPELKRIRSVLEGLFLLAWVERGLPMPLVNVKVHGYEVDDYWPEHNLVLELDGGAFHSDPVQRKFDLAKQRDLEARGLTVIRSTYEEFEANPGLVVDRIARALGLD